MPTELPLELRQVVRQMNGDQPLRVVDPDTHTVYVLVKAELFDQAQAALQEDVELADTYAAQSAAALRAGWGAPEMADYDHYDESRRKICP